MASQSHHARAHEALRSLDAAKLQKERNSHLRNTYLDSEDQLVYLNSLFTSHKLHQRMMETAAVADNGRHQFESELCFTETCKKLSYQRYMDNCQLQVPVSELEQEELYDRQRTTRFLREALLDIEKEVAVVAQGSDDVVQRMKLLIGRCEKVVDAATVSSASFFDQAQLMIDAARGAVNHEPVQVRLQVLVDELERLSNMNQAILTLQSQSKEEGDIAANEGHMYERVTLLEAMADVIVHKFRVMEEEDNVALKEVERRIRSSSEEVTSAISTLRQKTCSRQARLEADITKLTGATARAEEDERIARLGFQSDLDRSNEMLKANALEVESVWNQIFQLERRLQTLSNERRNEVDRRVKSIEREERRRVDMDHFHAFATDHSNRLTSALRMVEAQELLCDMMDEVLRGFAVVGTRRVQLDRQTVAEARVVARQEHLQHFREQYLHVGELLFKKERALEELTQRSIYAGAQQELAMDAYNPRAKEYSGLKAELDIEIGKMEDEIRVLQQKATLYVQAFKPTEKALRAEGKTFEHPVNELVHLNKEKSRKIAAFHALEVSQRGGGGALAAGTMIDASSQLVAEETERLERMKAQMHRMREAPPPGRALPQPKVSNCLSLLD